MARIMFFLALGLAMACAPPARAAPAPFQPVEARMAAAVAAGEAPSIAIAVIRDGELVWIDAEGWADVARRRPATPDTVYRIGSVSKSLTATVAALAQERGLVDLSQRAERYLPNLADSRLATATLADILNMAVGMTQAVYYRGAAGDTLALDADAFAARYAVRATGRDGRYDYSNMGPELVSRAVAAAAREPFEAFARRALLEPLGMKATYFGYHAAPEAARATSYRRDRAPFEREFESLPVAGAGMTASVRDLARFARLHLGGAAARGRISDVTLERLHGAPTAGIYGYGWGRIGDGLDEVLISDGQVNGGQAMIMLAPRRRMAAVVVSNTATDLAPELAMAAMERMQPGFTKTLQRNMGLLEPRLAAAAAMPAPPPGNWTARGHVWIDGRAADLSVTGKDGGVSVAIGGREAIVAKAAEPEGGFTRWALPCADILPACADGTNADLTLAVAVSGAALEGALIVDSRLGLFPYRIELRVD